MNNESLLVFLRLAGQNICIYLFGENKEWNSTDNLKIFGKVKVWKLPAALDFRRILRIKT